MDGGGAAPPNAATNVSLVAAPAGIRVENCYVFKSRLQEYAQKAGLPTPEYHTLKEGPSHEPVFKSTVVVNNAKYESLPGFFSRKAAEQSAAEVALMEIVKSAPVSETKSIPAVQETGLCKNLLQEYAQKMNYAIPSYICTKQASGVAPFVCTVEIGGIQYIGASARTKKEAEIKAARTALLAIQGQSEGCANGATRYIVVPGQRQVKEAEKKPAETPKPLKVKKTGCKKKRNRRKFVRKTDQIADAEKDGPREVGDVHDSDVPMQATVGSIMLYPDEEARRVEQEHLRDTAMLQPDNEARIVEQGIGMLLQDGEARRAEHELSVDTATVQFNKEVVMLQPGEEARMVELEPPRYPSSVQPCNEEARRVEHELSVDTATVHFNKEAVMLQPGEEARMVELEPPRYPSSVVQPCNEEARIIEQESAIAYVAFQRNGDAPDVKPPSSTAMMQREETEETESTVQEASCDDEFVLPN